MATAAENRAARAEPLAPERPVELRDAAHVADPARAWDVVDEWVWESFPASDPPGRWAGSDRAPSPTTRPRASRAQRLYLALRSWLRRARASAWRSRT